MKHRHFSGEKDAASKHFTIFIHSLPRTWEILIDFAWGLCHHLGGLCRQSLGVVQ
jgi:hypothetical protein